MLFDFHGCCLIFVDAVRFHCMLVTSSMFLCLTNFKRLAISANVALVFQKCLSFKAESHFIYIFLIVRSSFGDLCFRKIVFKTPQIIVSLLLQACTNLIFSSMPACYGHH